MRKYSQKENEMNKKLQHGLSKRERQIMEVIYRKKGFLKHERMGRRYVYSPTIPHNSAVRSTLQNVLRTYFNNSVEDAVSALMKVHGKHLTDDDYDRLIKRIEKARKEGIQ